LQIVHPGTRHLLFVSEDAILSETARKRWTLVACILGSSIVFVDSTVVNVALPAIRRDLGGGLALQQWVVDAYLLTLGSLILVGGSLGDLFGGRRIFGVGVAAFGVTSVLCAAAPDGNTLIVARGLQGVAGALLTPASLAVIVATFDGEERARAIGTWTAWSGVAFVLGPLLGGQLLAVASWRWLFLINVPLVAACLVLVVLVLPRRADRRRDARVDWIGALICTAGLAGPVFALIEQGRRGWDPVVVVSLVGGVVLLVLFVAWERHTTHPMLPLSLFSRRNFSAANLETFTVYAGLSTFTFFLVLYLQEIAGWSPFRSGLALVPVTAIMFVLSPRAGALSSRLGPRLFMGVGPLVAAAGLLMLVRLGRTVDYAAELLPAICIFGVGLSMTVAPLTATVLADAHEGDAGIASGVNTAVARVAALIGIAAVGAAIAGEGNDLDLHGFRVSMAITTGLVAIGGLIGLLWVRNPPR
jgi:EmrB/QacA subfamily drug resistance transporter